MTKIVDARDQFQLKTLLDGATTRLNGLAAALEASGEPEGGSLASLLSFVEKLMSGEIEAFYDAFEDSDALYNLMDSDPVLYGQLIKVTMRYAHQDHLVFTAAMAEQFRELSPLMIVDCKGNIVHSCLSHPHTDLLLDANGVVTQVYMLDRYRRLLGGRLGSIQLRWLS